MASPQESAGGKKTAQSKTQQVSNNAGNSSTSSSSLIKSSQHKRKAAEPSFQPGIPVKIETLNHEESAAKSQQFSLNTSVNSSQQSQALATASLLNQFVSKQQNNQQQQSQQQQQQTNSNVAGSDYMQHMFQYQASVLKSNAILSNYLNLKMSNLLPNLSSTPNANANPASMTTPSVPFQSQMYAGTPSASSNGSKMQQQQPQTDALTHLNKCFLTKNSSPSPTNQQLDVEHHKTANGGRQSNKYSDNNAQSKDVLDLSLPNRSRSSADAAAKLANNANSVSD